jgi:hypothetical protein
MANEPFNTHCVPYPTTAEPPTNMPMRAAFQESPVRKYIAITEARPAHRGRTCARLSSVIRRPDFFGGHRTHYSVRGYSVASKIKAPTGRPGLSFIPCASAGTELGGRPCVDQLVMTRMDPLRRDKSRPVAPHTDGSGRLDDPRVSPRTNARVIARLRPRITGRDCARRPWQVRRVAWR